MSKEVIDDSKYWIASLRNKNSVKPEKKLGKTRENPVLCELVVCTEFLNSFTEF